MSLSHVCFLRFLFLHNREKAGLCSVLCTSSQRSTLNSGVRQLSPLVCAGPSLTRGSSWSKPCLHTESAGNHLSQTRNWTWIPSVCLNWWRTASCWPMLIDSPLETGFGWCTETLVNSTSSSFKCMTSNGKHKAGLAMQLGEMKRLPSLKE